MPSRSPRRSRPLRVLVDRSRDSGCSQALPGLQPTSRFEVTDSRGPLTEELLARHDVATVCGFSPVGHEPAEIEALRRFVEGGGGLLLASSTVVFEKDVRRPIEELGINALAQEFGIEFLSLGAAQGPTFWRGGAQAYRREDAVVEPHEAFGHVPLTHSCVGTPAPLRAPAEAEVLIRHRTTGEPFAVALSFGAGRVLALSDVSVPAGGTLTLVEGVVTWLGAAKSRSRRPTHAIPREIGPPLQTRKKGDLTVHFDPRVEHRVDQALDYLERLVKLATEWTAGQITKARDVTLAHSAASWPLDWRQPLIGALAADHALAFHLALFVLRHPWSWNWTTRPLGEVFGWWVLPQVFALHAMRHLGFEREAEEREQRLREECAERDPDGQLDITREYESQHPKALCLALDLQAEFGADLFARTLELLTADKAQEGYPGLYASSGDVGLAFLSRAAGRDLFPWFAERGRTSRPLPLVEATAEEFTPAILETLERVVRCETAPLSDRLDALLEWAQQTQGDDGLLLADLLADAAPYRRLLAGARLAQTCDTRAAEALSQLAASTADQAIRALAALLCTETGSPALASELAADALRFEPRFRLEAAYVLDKAGQPAPPELTFGGMRTKTGEPVCDLEVEYDGYLKLFARVEGCRVANVFGAQGWTVFPQHTPSLTYHVDWVHTGERWRRRGLSRYTLAELLRHPLAEPCGAIALGTGTRNVAHTMYRSFGFVDIRRGGGFERPAGGSGEAPVVAGVSFRRSEEKDVPAVAGLMRTHYAPFFQPHGGRTLDRRPGDLGWVAERGQALIGCLVGFRQDETFEITDLCLAEGESREAIARALLALAEAEAVEQKCPTICWNHTPDDDLVKRALARQGYFWDEWGGVGMWGVRSLPILLGELVPLLEYRLKEAKLQEWSGRLDLTSPSHRGRLAIEAGRVHVPTTRRGAPSLALACSDTTMSKIVMGRETPFEAYLQTNLTIEPRVTDPIVKLLETLFPRMPVA